MALSYIPLDAITEQHLRDLIQTGARESLYIDYKSQTYDKNEAARKEFLADICSFANAAGGDIVIGMAETGGVPSEITPFTDDADQERLRLEQMARDGVEPRIIGLAVRVVTVSGGVVFIVRVPKSWNPPHRVKFQGSNRFYARTSGGKYEPSIEELRNLFLAAPHIAERMRAFRMERIARIAAGETPVLLSQETSARAVLHVVPFSAFGRFDPFLIQKIYPKWGAFPPYGREHATHRVANFDGFVTLSSLDAYLAPQGGGRETPPHNSYCQVFRNGALESVGVGPDQLTEENFQHFLHRLNWSANLLTTRLSKLGVAPPYAVLFSLLNMPPMQPLSSGLPQSAARRPYHFIEILRDTVPKDDTGVAEDIIPLFDHIAASLFGVISSNIRPTPKAI